MARRSVRRNGGYHAILGQRLQDVRRALSDAVFDARQDLNSFDDAWNRGDWNYLIDRGYVTERMVQNAHNEED
jgi:hypothetical protein